LLGSRTPDVTADVGVDVTEPAMPTRAAAMVAVATIPIDAMSAELRAMARVVLFNIATILRVRQVNSRQR
jgi:hypothetical protein